MNHTHKKTHTLSPTLSTQPRLKLLKLSKNRTSKKFSIKHPFLPTISPNDSISTIHNNVIPSQRQTTIYSTSDHSKLFKPDTDSSTMNTISTDSPIPYILTLHKSNEPLCQITSIKQNFPFINSFRLNNKSKTKYLNRTSLIYKNILSPSSSIIINQTSTNQHTLKRKNKINHTTIGMPLLTNKCNEIEDNYINIQDNILLTKCKSKNEIRNNKRNQTQKELKERINLMNILHEKKEKDNNKNKMKEDEIMKDVLDEGVIVNDEYHEKMFMKCRHKTFRALMEMKCIDVLNPVVAFQDNKNVRKQLMLNEDDKYRKMLKEKGGYKGRKGRKNEETTFWVKERKKDVTCAERLRKQNDEIMNMVKSTSKLKERLYRKYDKVKNK